MNQVILFVLCLAAIASAQNYCSLCADHTMCRYQGVVGSSCSPKLFAGVNATDKTTIVSFHNALRQKVATGLETQGKPGPQPQASNMHLMYWNSELEQIAQRWADQCIFGHDTCRKTSAMEVGQNVYMSASTVTPRSPNWSAAITAWYDEVKDFNRTWINPFKFSSGIGHYSQVAWATTAMVGCGYSVYQKPNDPMSFIQLYVCNYGRAGNLINGVMYQQGKPCSQCPAAMSCKTAQYPALCSYV